MSVCLSCAGVGGASASQVEEGVPRDSLEPHLEQSSAREFSFLL